MIKARFDVTKMTAKVCEFDGKVFQNGTQFSHHKQLHLSMDFPCDVCLKKFKNQRSLKVHKRLHDDPSSTSQTCVQCQLVCSNATNLSRHVRSQHEKKHFTCAVADCGKEFNRKDNLQKHYAECKSRAMDGIMREEKFQLQNKFAEKTKPFTDAFENYVEERSNIIFTCETCDRSFSNKSSLSVHKSNTHSKKEDMTCIMCKKIFANVSGFKRKHTSFS